MANNLSDIRDKWAEMKVSKIQKSTIDIEDFVPNIDEMIKAIWKTLLLILYLMQNVFICVIRMLVCLQAWRQTQRIRLWYESRR